ncbi:hypothetical protein AESSP_02710 [Aestuariimicrobium sp. T2.26MG-19.2B]|nr:hypothetical protein AESSP_02710 [Aestuariimicrobium sp. T2.26MG-19.2B]
MDRVVLVISDERDGHIPFVTNHLESEYLLVDPGAIISGSSLTFQHLAERNTLSLQETDLTALDITGVWFRKPQRFRHMSIPVPQEYFEYSASALTQLTVTLYSQLQSATWVSDYYAISRASNKFLQLQLAATVGLKTLATVITSSPLDAREFLARYPRAVVKPLSQKHPRVDGRQMVLLTHEITEPAGLDLQGLELAPSIFQETVAVAEDIRVTIVGPHCFAASVRSAPSEALGHHHVGGATRIRDSRFGHYSGAGVVIEPWSLPEEVAKKCVALTNKLGLNFSAIDLIVDDDGQYHFLELNPNGQWAYIEKNTGLPIGASIAELLQRGARGGTSAQ